METIDLKKLYEPLPSEAITPHPTKTYLSSIKAVYVTERFNDVFGIGKWSIMVNTEHVNHDTGMVIVKVIFQVKSMGIYYESYGGNDNGGISNKNFDLGDAYKGATTDALTKIGSFLGVAIDVFKGKHDKKQQEVKKKWLNLYTNKTDKKLTTEMDGVYRKMVKGDYTSVQDIRIDFAVSKDVESTIEAWFVKLKKPV